MNLEENGSVIQVDDNSDTLKVEVIKEVINFSNKQKILKVINRSDQNQFLPSDIVKEENLDFDQSENFCSLSEKQFNSPGDLEIHQKRIHTNNDSDIEPKESKTSNDACENLNEKSESSKEIYYFCSLCETKFYSCLDLELHLDTTHTNSEIETFETINSSTINDSIKEKSKRSYVQLNTRENSFNDMKRIYSDYFDFTSLESTSVIKNGLQTTYSNSEAVCLTCQGVFQCTKNSFVALKYHAEKVHHIKLGTNPENYYASIEKKYSEKVNNSMEILDRNEKLPPSLNFNLWTRMSTSKNFLTFCVFFLTSEDISVNHGKSGL